jgi:hypothetical protein
LAVAFLGVAVWARPAILRIPTVRLLARSARLRIVLHHAHATIGSEHTESIHILAVTLHALGADDFATGLPFGTADRVRRRRIGGTRIGLLRPLLGHGHARAEDGDEQDQGAK